MTDKLKLVIRRTKGRIDRNGYRNNQRITSMTVHSPGCRHVPTEEQLDNMSWDAATEVQDRSASDVAWSLENQPHWRPDTKLCLVCAPVVAA